MVITFNETMRNQGWSINFNGLNTQVPDANISWISPTQLSITPIPGGWPLNTTIGFELNPAGYNASIQDLSGNPLVTRTLTFTTGNN